MHNLVIEDSTFHLTMLPFSFFEVHDSIFRNNNFLSELNDDDVNTDVYFAEVHNITFVNNHVAVTGILYIFTLLLYSIYLLFI